MTQYLLAMYHPDGPVPENLDEIMTGVEAIRTELREQGSWVFGAGLAPSTTATVVRKDGGEFLTTDGPYVEGHEHLGGFSVIDVPDLDEALRWASRYTEVTGVPMEVRPARAL